jgi:hypothetical protein
MGNIYEEISGPTLGKRAIFSQCQDACRKDVERAFGGLQGRFAFVRYPTLIWSKNQMTYVMIVCVILPNIIIESERKHPAHDTEPWHQ